MSEFKTIETQEQLNAIIGERIVKAKESAKKDFEGWISPEDFEKKVEELRNDNETLKASLEESNEKIKGFDAQLSEKDKKLKEYEIGSVKTKVAAELGLDYKLVSRISGESEDEIRKDAESLLELMNPRISAPRYSNEVEIDNETASMKKMIDSLRKGN